MSMVPGPGNSEPVGGSTAPGPAPHEQTWDAMETYFQCITTCSLDDGDCITHCVEQLRAADDAGAQSFSQGTRPTNRRA